METPDHENPSKGRKVSWRVAKNWRKDEKVLDKVFPRR